MNLCLIVLLCLACGACLADELDVTVKQGQLRGAYWNKDLFIHSSRRFLGIPFAAPPVNELRWQPPQAPASWQGVRDATYFGYDCPQEHDNSGLAGNTSESCLYLNVYTPLEKDIKHPLPVMMFFFGGSWSWGGTTFPLYNGDHIIEYRSDVVVVTVNYRLGALGFLGSKEIQADTTDGSAGNFGIQDQRAAMEWVKENIAAFGGNPDLLTIWGESAGAGSVSNHLVHPKSAGKFQRAIMESGPIAPWVSMNMTVAQAKYDYFADFLNCTQSNATQELICMRGAPWQVVADAHDHTVYQTFTDWAPVVDGVELPENPQKLAMAGKFPTGIQVMLGTNRNEGTLLIDHWEGGHDAPASEFPKWVNSTLDDPALAAAVIEAYPLSKFKSPWWAAVEVVGNFAMNCPARQTARWLTKAGIPTYLYFFTHVIDEIALYPYLGVFHASELIFVFNLPSGLFEHKYPVVLSPRERTLAHHFVDYWTSFGVSGDPNADTVDSLPHWPVYDEATDQNLNLDLDITVDTNLFKDVCDMYAKYYVPL